MPHPQGITCYWRKRPHWRLENATYFVTWRLERRQPILIARERDAVLASLRHFDGDRYHLDAYVVMDDHVHALVRPAPDHRLEMLIASWKGYTAKRIIAEGDRRAPLWQAGYFDRIVRDDADLAGKRRYIEHNPFKRWPELADYRWRSS